VATCSPFATLPIAVQSVPCDIILRDVCKLWADLCYKKKTQIFTDIVLHYIVVFRENDKPPVTKNFTLLAAFVFVCSLHVLCPRTQFSLQ
jgi:hypothetical protein